MSKQLVLGLITIGPWALLVAYDILLYTFRSIAHHTPYIGGRARGFARPSAPALDARPDGHRRNFSFAGLGSSSGTSPVKKRARRETSERLAGRGLVGHRAIQLQMDGASDVAIDSDASADVEERVAGAGLRHESPVRRSRRTSQKRDEQ